VSWALQAQELGGEDPEHQTGQQIQAVRADPAQVDR